MENYPKPIVKSCMKTIYNQMEDLIYKIHGNNENYELGFFIRIKHESKNYPVLITNSNLYKQIKESNKIFISYNNNNELKSIIELGNIKFELKKYDTAVIEIKENKNIKFLEIDENIFNPELESYYYKESIYILQNNNKKEISVSFGIIKYIFNKDINYSSNINLNSKSSPIFNLNNHKLIGIHGYKSNYFNKGIIINYIIERFINKINNNKKLGGLTLDEKYNTHINNKISIKVNVSKKEINKKIYFIDNFYHYDDKYQNEVDKHDHIKELNIYNAELYINGEKKEYKKYFIPLNEGIYLIELKFNINLTDSSYMFTGCENNISINFDSFDTKNIKNMKSMFNGCVSLISLSGLSEWNTEKVNFMSAMFWECYSLKSLPDISKWNTKNVIDMSHMFRECISLISLPDISEWNTSNVKYMSRLFYKCKSLKSLPDISKWNTSNVEYISEMILYCCSLEYLPYIKGWNLRKVENKKALDEIYRHWNTYPFS